MLSWNKALQRLFETTGVKGTPPPPSYNDLH